MAVRARDVMTRRVLTVDAEDPIERAEKRMLTTGFSALPVVRDIDRLVGIVSLVDVLRAREQDSDGTVGGIMTTEVLALSPTTSAAVVAHRMRTYGELRVMPIVERGRLVGIVTRSDLLRGPRRAQGRLGRLFRPTLPDPTPVRPPRPAVAGATTVGEVMTRTGLVTVDPTTPCSRAVELLLAHRFSALPVTEPDGAVVGIVSEADLLRDPLDGTRGVLPRTVGAAMTRDPTVVHPGTPLDQARALVVDRGFRVLPVVEEGGLVGVLSRSDLI
ncbi:CBS domain-containing protein [Pseudonocardia sp. WMMC193]|uniref:CBS domain-containing protein n=1 Tax=Pseudonocardia sp. WMMC193 TaxID=2911965 RepID=UPI001F1E5A9E|nr:CBS domain-containing protein [Pseudonocardia sp. WMMC193]MCF7548691.1 CBS domain-containing protein [Pseudonocardia sp. WMMC193]